MAAQRTHFHQYYHRCFVYFPLRCSERSKMQKRPRERRRERERGSKQKRFRAFRIQHVYSRRRSRGGRPATHRTMFVLCLTIFCHHTVNVNLWKSVYIYFTFRLFLCLLAPRFLCYAFMNFRFDIVFLCLLQRISKRSRRFHFAFGMKTKS